MAIEVTRKELTAAELRAAAAKMKDSRAARRMLAIGRVARVGYRSQRALPETDVRRCVRNRGGQDQSSGSTPGHQSWLRFSDFRTSAPSTLAR